MKNIYCVAMVEDEAKKQFSYIIKIETSYNLLYEFEKIKAAAKYNGGELVCLHYCETKKKAEEIAMYWNITAKNNGCYMEAMR